MNFGRVFLDALFPITCVLCDRSGSGGLICNECQNVSSQTIPFPLPSPLREFRTLGRYDGPLGSLVRRAKYGRNVALLDELGALLGRGMTGWSGVDAIIPVPSSMPRRIIRGFDHAFRLARAASLVTMIPVATPLRWSIPVRQVGRSASLRRTLSPSAMASSESLSGMSIVVVDDVVTTGATLRAAAAAAVAAGARSVRGMAVVHVEGKEI